MSILVVRPGHFYWIEQGRPYEPRLLAGSIVIDNPCATNAQRIYFDLKAAQNQPVMLAPQRYLPELLAGECASFSFRLSAMTSAFTLTARVSFELPEVAGEQILTRTFTIEGESVGLRPRRMFVSYASADYPRIQRLLPELRCRGDVWIAARDLGPTSWFGTEIRSALRAADLFVVFISRVSIASQWVRDEIELAANRARFYNSIGILSVALEAFPVCKVLDAYPTVDCTSAGAASFLGDAVEHIFRSQISNPISLIDLEQSGGRF